MVAVLAGGTGGAKLAAGMLDVVGAGRADGHRQHRRRRRGLRAPTSPPTPTSSPGGSPALIDERGWGIRGDTFHVMDALESAGRPAWFRLGDRDLALCLMRTERAARGPAADRGARRGRAPPRASMRACCR